MKEGPDQWLISGRGLREKRGKATQLTFRQVSVGGPAQAEAGKCTWVPSALFSYKHGSDVPAAHPAPGLAIQLCFTTHELLGPVATRP